MATLVSLTRTSIPLGCRLSPHTVGNQVLLNHIQVAGYKKRQTSRLLHKPDFDEYDKLPGDEYQTVYKGFYDDKRHTDPRAYERFYRLNWGGWIRARGGRGRTGQWRRDGPKMWWSQQHVLCSERQCEQLERMFEVKYRKKKYFVDHPYEQYEEREFEFLPTGHAPYSYSYVKSSDYSSKN